MKCTRSVVVIIKGEKRNSVLVPSWVYMDDMAPLPTQIAGTYYMVEYLVNVLTICKVRAGSI